MLEQAPSQGRRLAILAVSGLFAGLPACAAPNNNEVVVDPTAPLNTPSATPAAVATGEPTAEVAIPEDAPEQPKPRIKKPRAAARRGLADCCAGKNDCKGLGGCKTDRHDCRGKNDCKGLGGCQVGQCETDSVVVEEAPPPPPPPPPRVKGSAVLTAPSGTKMCCKGRNDCKGKGNCKTNDNACMGQNDCKGKGGCKGPC